MEDECAAIDEISVSSEGITNLKGIEWFGKLSFLQCGSNQLTSMDVSGCTALKNLICYGNQLTSLDVSGCTALTVLHCSSNQLTSLDVSKCTALKDLDCGSNQLTSLDVSGCTALKNLYCSSNQLTSLDVSKCTALEFLECFSNKLMKLDVSKNVALYNLKCDSNQLTNLDVRHNTALWKLKCSSNQLTNLDVSKNTELMDLDCFNNQLTSLDISKNTWLCGLYCYSNQISSLDITNCETLVNSVSQGRETTDKGSIGFNKMVSDGVSYILQIDPTTTLTANGKVIYAGEQKTAKNLAKAKVTVKDKAFTGKALKPKVTVKLNGVTLKKGTDYTVSYKNNVNIGKATVTVKGVGKYTGTKKAAFTINPKKVSGLNLKAGKKQLTATWKQAAGGVTGYQIQYGLTKDFKGEKKVTVKKAATVEKVLKKLKTGKAYYVRIRAYKKVGKKTYWSDWSKAVKSKKVK